MASYYVTLKRRRYYTEEGVAFVVAKDQDDAIEQALEMVTQEEVDFIRSSETDTEPGSLDAISVEPVPC